MFSFIGLLFSLFVFNAKNKLNLFFVEYPFAKQKLKFMISSLNKKKTVILVLELEREKTTH